MDLEEIQCPLCHKVYDESEHLPILLPDCGHSYCSLCISEEFSKLKQEDEDASPRFFVCPEDE